MKAFSISAMAASMMVLATPALPAHAAQFPAPAAVTAAFPHTPPMAIPMVPVAAYDDDWDDDDRRDRRRWRGRDRDWDNGRRLGRRDRVWRGEDGRFHCRRNDGTTGLVIGAGAGALLGRSIDTRGDRTLGTVLGAVGGGLLGREVERRGARCR